MYRKLASAVVPQSATLIWQEFSGHAIRRPYDVAARIRREFDTRAPNAYAAGDGTLRCTRISPAWPAPGSRDGEDESAPFDSREEDLCRRSIPTVRFRLRLQTEPWSFSKAWEGPEAYLRWRHDRYAPRRHQQNIPGQIRRHPGRHGPPPDDNLVLSDRWRLVSRLLKEQLTGARIDEGRTMGRLKKYLCRYKARHRNGPLCTLPPVGSALRFHYGCLHHAMTIAAA